MRNSNRDTLSRRRFFQTTAVAGGALAASSWLTTGQANAAWKAELKTGVVILFQGDSITDAGRDRKNPSANNSRGLGRGYPNLIAGGLLADYPAKKMFDEAVKLAPPEYWAVDGVHPTLAGHALMTKTWREVVGV